MASQQHSPSGEKEKPNKGTNDEDTPPSRPPGPTKIQTYLQKAGLNMPFPLLMFKAAVPPTVALAMYQSDAVAAEYRTQGYLVAIASVLGFAIMPRAKFVQNLLLNTLSICIATSMALLTAWCAVQARLHTTPPGRPPTGYNSSASAVCAVWLFFQIFLINSIRSKLPQMNFPVILYAIFANVALTYATQFPTSAAAISFAKTLIKAFLTGFGLATATHFLVVPVNARKPVFGEMNGMLGAMHGLINAQIAYMQAFEDDHLAHSETSSSESSNDKDEKSEDASEESRHHHGLSAHFRKSKRPSKSEAKGNAIKAREEALRGAASGLSALMAKLQGDLPFAKREVAFGKLNSQDIKDTMKKLSACALPLFGLGSLVEITRHAAHLGGWNDLLNEDRSHFEALPDQEKHEREHAFEEWQKVMRTLHEPFTQISSAMNDALEHIMLTLEFKARPKSKKQSQATYDDPEAKADSDAPGEKGFAGTFAQKVDKFYNSRQMTLHTWCEQRGVHLPPDSFDVKAAEKSIFDSSSKSGRRHRGQLYLILYMEYLLYAASKAMLEMVQYADSRVADGTMSKKRLIFPGGKRLTKWVKEVVSTPENSGEVAENLTGTSEQPLSLDYGEGYIKHDPEHLPPTTAFQRFGNFVRLIPHTFRSEHSAHGFRAACATMSIGIICYLERTQTFFLQQRLFWAMIMVAFSMQRTAGQAVFQYTMRIGGTLIAMIASYVIWYIVNGHTAGVLVFEFLFVFACFWVLFHKPRYVLLGILSAITSILIIGYELQVQKLGVRASESNGQPAYPTYVLAPYRLATVVGGLSVAYFWTIFPYPISEHTELRRDVASTMHLLSRYYTMVHETVKIRVQNNEGDLTQKTSPGHIINKTRTKTFLEMQVTINQLKQVVSFSKWQFDFGGRFPVETYKEMADRLERIMRYMALVGYASTSFRDTHQSAEDSNAEWMANFTRLVSDVAPTSHEFTMRLSILSACLRSATPLPPYMPDLEAFHLTRRLEQMDKDILSVRHLAEPGYAAFAVLQIASRILVDELNSLTENVRELCGEMDFTVKIAGQNP